MAESLPSGVQGWSSDELQKLGPSSAPAQKSDALPEGVSGYSPEQLQSLGKHGDKTLDQWATTPWSDVLPSTETQLRSLKNYGTGFLGLVSRPTEFVPPIAKGIATGVASKMLGPPSGFTPVKKTWADPLVVPQDPEQKAKDEAFLDSMLEPISSIGGAKKAIATDPASFLGTLTGGAGLAGKVVSRAGAAADAAGLSGVVSKPLIATGTALSTASKYTDPIMGPINTVSDAAPTATGMASSAISRWSKIPEETSATAFRAGAEPNGSLLKHSYDTFASGNGDFTQFKTDANYILGQMKAADIADWRANKSQLQLQTPVDINPIIQKIRAEAKRIGPNPSASGQQALDELRKVYNNLVQRWNTPNMPGLTVEGLDSLKQQLYADAEGLKRPTGVSLEGTPASNAVHSVRDAIRDSIVATDPDYAKVMDRYQYLTENWKAAQDNSKLANLIKDQSKQDGGKLLQRMAQYDPTIPYKVAGATVNAAKEASHPVARSMRDIAAAALHNYSGYPGAGITTAGTMADAIFSNPHIMSAVPYKLGEFSRNPAIKAAGKAGEAVSEGAASLKPMAGALVPLAGNFQRAEDERTGRKSGGRVVNHAAKAAELVKAAERARKGWSKKTEPLLEQHDSTIAHALSVANQHI